MDQSREAFSLTDIFTLGTITGTASALYDAARDFSKKEPSGYQIMVGALFLIPSRLSPKHLRLTTTMIFGLGELVGYGTNMYLARIASYGDIEKIAQESLH